MSLLVEKERTALLSETETYKRSEKRQKPKSNHSQKVPISLLVDEGNHAAGNPPGSAASSHVSDRQQANLRRSNTEPQLPSTRKKSSTQGRGSKHSRSPRPPPPSTNPRSASVWGRDKVGTRSRQARSEEKGKEATKPHASSSEDRQPEKMRRFYSTDRAASSRSKKSEPGIEKVSSERRGHRHKAGWALQSQFVDGERPHSSAKPTRAQKVVEDKYLATGLGKRTSQRAQHCCPKCGRLFVTPWNLAKHVQEGNCSRRRVLFQCHVCGLSFGGEYRRDFHVRVSRSCFRPAEDV